LNKNVGRQFIGDEKNLPEGKSISEEVIFDFLIFHPIKFRT